MAHSLWFTGPQIMGEAPQSAKTPNLYTTIKLSVHYHTSFCSQVDEGWYDDNFFIWCIVTKCYINIARDPCSLSNSNRNSSP